MARVLVIEDEPSVQWIIRRVLTEGGHEVIEADTTRAGLDAACAVPADVVLGDVCLGRRDGISVMAAIRHARPTVPLVAVSGRDREEVLDRLNAAGLRQAVWCLQKPFNHHELLTTIRRALAEAHTPP